MKKTHTLYLVTNSNICTILNGLTTNEIVDAIDALFIDTPNNSKCYYGIVFSNNETILIQKGYVNAQILLKSYFTTSIPLSHTICIFQKETLNDFNLIFDWKKFK